MHNQVAYAPPVARDPDRLRGGALLAQLDDERLTGITGGHDVPVVADATEQCVGSVADAPEREIVAGSSGHQVRPGSARDRVCAGASGQRVVAGAALDSGHWADKRTEINEVVIGAAIDQERGEPGRGAQVAAQKGVVALGGVQLERLDRDDVHGDRLGPDQVDGAAAGREL